MRWAIRGGLAVIDQATYSGTNFILSVLLARWLMPEQYGVYSLSLAIYQFAFQGHNALILEPMSVLGPSKMRNRLSSYIREQIRLHFVVCSLGGAVIGFFGIFMLYQDRFLGKSILFIGLLLSLILFPILMRRVFYVFHKTGLAVVISIAYGLILYGVIWITGVSVNRSVDIVFPSMGLAGLISGLILLNQIPKETTQPASFRAIWLENWQYGKFLVIASLLIAFAAQAQTLVVGAVLGFRDAGIFRAMQNVAQPMILFFTAVSAFVLPSLSSDFGVGNMARLRLKGRYLLAVFLMVALSFEVLLVRYYPNIETLIYDGKFSSFAYLIPVWGLVPVTAVITYVYYFLLQSIQRPNAILIGSLIWALASLVLSVLLSAKWGLLGATLSVVLSYLIAGIAFAFLFGHYRSKLESPRSS